MYKCGICIQANFNFLNIPQNIKKKKSGKMLGFKRFIFTTIINNYNKKGYHKNGRNHF